MTIQPPTLREMESYLEHAGVKGMKWGVRRDLSGGQANAPRKSDPKMDAVKAKVARDYVAKHSKVTLEEATARINSPTKLQTFMNSRTGKITSAAFDVVWWGTVMQRVSDL